LGASPQTIGGSVALYLPRVLLLSICPGLGQQYSGRLVRGIIFYISLVVLSWMAAIAYMYATSPLVGLLLLSVPFIGVALIAVDAYMCAKRQPSDYRLKRYNRYWIYAVVFLTLLVTVNPLMDYLVGGQIVRALLITSDSMHPTVLNRDLVVINKLAKPSLGDIVLIKFGENRTSRSVIKLIKDQVLRRVIAKAGDTLEIRGRQVILNGEILNENYVTYGEEGSFNPLMESAYRLEPVFIPVGSYFVLSDARQYSFDSRVFGLVSDEEVSGVATKVFWSWNLDDGSFKWNRTAMSLR
jgi:signal peptidase I